MAIKNYTSQVPANRSISWIEGKLARSGANQILKDIDIEGRVTGIAFILPVNGTSMAFKLPAQIKACEEVLKSEVRRPKADTFKRIKEQAERTAWKIVADWVDAQMAMIELSQVDFLQVFLPYMYNPVEKKTFYELSKAKGIHKLLPGAIVHNQSEIGNRKSQII